MNKPLGIARLAGKASIYRDIEELSSAGRKQQVQEEAPFPAKERAKNAGLENSRDID